MRSVKKLLVVDDDDAFRESMELEFQDRGYQVLTANDHRAALGLAAVHRPQYAVIDLRLGGERGLQVLSDLVERLPTIRAVVLTGYGSVATAVEAIKLGARHYLTKPCDPEAIEQAFHADQGDPNVVVPERPPSLARHEREYIEYVLASTSGNISEAARRLGLHRQSLQRKLRKYPPRD
ncbi:MAG: two-component system response regulator RegA [Myxococcota bacterium]|jgi:two-component system response regulator RegA